jgi:type IV secretory pathway VirD2 relaxase
MAERERELSMRVAPARRPRRERSAGARSILRGIRLGGMGVRRVRLPVALRAKTYQQRSVVKVSYARSVGGVRWAAHGSSLAREGAAREGERGVSFDAGREDIELEGTLRAWQRAGDTHVFKVIVSPEHGDQMDLVEHARQLVSAMEKDLDTRLEWAGIVHMNTAHPHVHLVTRGRDELGDPLVIDREYIGTGIRLRSRDLATRELGVRWERDLLDARERAVERRAFTDVDRAILERATPGRTVTYETPTWDHPAKVERRLQEMRRLHFLSQLGLAEKSGARTWAISEHLESALRAWIRRMQVSSVGNRYGSGNPVDGSTCRVSGGEAALRSPSERAASRASDRWRRESSPACVPWPQRARGGPE